MEVFIIYLMVDTLEQSVLAHHRINIGVFVLNDGFTLS